MNLLDKVKEDPTFDKSMIDDNDVRKIFKLLLFINIIGL